MEKLYRIEMLGGLQLHHADHCITRFTTHKTAALLAYLGFYLHRRHPREVLVEMLWPESEEAAALQSLSQALSSLRRQLEPPGITRGAVILADRTTVALNAEVITTDVSEFESVLRSLEQSPSGSPRRELLSRAINLYTGELLPGYYEEWISAEQQRLSDLFHSAVQQSINGLEAEGSYLEAISLAHRAAALNPLDEDIKRTILRLRSLVDQPSAAGSRHRDLHSALQHALVQDPGQAATRAAQRLTAGIVQQNEGSHAGKIVLEDENLREMASGRLRSSHGDIPGEEGASGDESLSCGTLTFLAAAVGPQESSPFSRHGSPKLPAWGSQPSPQPGHTGGFLAAPASGTTPAPDSVDGKSNHNLDYIIREEIHRQGGRVLQQGLDWLMAAFRSAGTALECATAIQRALPQPASGLRLGIRMALSTGDVLAGQPESDSPAMSQARHLLGAAHPGQVLCAEATAVLGRQQISPEVSLVDLGIYRLSTSASAARIFQVQDSRLSQRIFPPLHAEPGPRGDLPYVVSHFFGREGDLAGLERLLHPDSLEAPSNSFTGSRLVTLTGPGGIGKTRLALEVARRLSGPFQGSVWFVPLADVAEPRRIIDTISGVLRLPRSPHLAPLDQVIEALSRGRTLLVLDNLEHLLSSRTPGGQGSDAVEAAGVVLRALLERASSLRCLVTSRQLLGLEGEYEFPVSPLPVPSESALVDELVLNESVQLFLDRAQAVRADFQLTERNAAVVGALCGGLEGIPLAIELAAARIQVLTPAQILSQIERRLEFLVGRRRDASSRHRTLRETIAWSYRLLDPEYQRCFAAISVFRDGWTLEAADAVCMNGERGSSLEALSVLRESSLVLSDEVRGQMRFRMLETLREYAAEQLAVEELENLKRLHAEYFLGLAEMAVPELDGPRQPLWLERLKAEHGNFRAALKWSLDTAPEMAARLAAALWPFWAVRGHLSEGREWLALAQEKMTDTTPARPHLLYGAGCLALHQGDYATATTILHQSLELYRAINDIGGIARALRSLGGVSYSQGHKDASRDYLEQSLALSRELGDRHGIASTLQALGNVTGNPGECEPARAVYQEALAIARELGCRDVIARCLNNLGVLASGGGNFQKAREFFEESLSVYREVENKQGIAHILSNLGKVAFWLEEMGPACSLYQECLQLQRELGDRRGIAFTLEGFGMLALAQDNAARAATLIAAADTLRKTIGSPVPDYQQRVWKESVDAILSSLGEEAFQRAWIQGQSLELEEALQTALQP